MELLDWRDGQPYSRIFGDIYFSRSSGIEEARHVFLRNNCLAKRWQALAPKGLFTVAETGFGTGLNFLCAWQLWRETAPETARLQFVSTEKYPLSCADLGRALAMWPELSALTRLLLTQYALPSSGMQQLLFNDGRVTLTLLLGDACETLSQLHAEIDAWFLDGFAPAKNPDMWQPELFDTMSRLSAHGATFATYTCAGMVRRGLISAGFEVEKVPGFGTKREMLRGSYVHPTMILAGAVK